MTLDVRTAGGFLAFLTLDVRTASGFSAFRSRVCERHRAYPAPGPSWGPLRTLVLPVCCPLGAILGTTPGSHELAPPMMEYLGGKIVVLSPPARFFSSDPPCTRTRLQRSSELHAYVESSRHWAGELGMGRTGSSLDGSFPPQGGGRTPRRVDPHVGEKRSGPW